jgi:Mn-containing catalase
VTDLLQLLEEFYREKLAMLLRHEAGARLVGQYDVNNTYQYIVNREEAHLAWVGKAIEELGGKIGDASEPDRSSSQKDGKGDRARRVFEEDARDAQAFVDRWRPRADGMVNARHAKMLRVILGEVLEHKRFFEQALAGRTDLLGRREVAVGPVVGEVLPTRWIE